jgi:hypothetical protein
MAYTSNKWEVRFRSDGSVVNPTTDVPQSVRIFVYVTGNDPAASSSPTLVRAISLFGPSSMTKLWRWDGSAWKSR